MKLELTKEFIEPLIPILIAAGKETAAHAAQEAINRYGATYLTVSLADYGRDGLDLLYEYAKSVGNRSVMMHLAALRNVIDNPHKNKIGQLTALEEGLAKFLEQDAIDMWLYKRRNSDGVYLAYYVQEIRYHPGNRSREERPYVSLTLIANAAFERETSLTLTFYSDDIQGKTIPELLAANSYYHETQALKDEYDSFLMLFELYRPMVNEQFMLYGTAQTDDGWRSRAVTAEGGMKVINDESQVKRKFRESGDPRYWRDRGHEVGFDKAPFHPFIFCFNLKLHTPMWAHVSTLTPYVYRSELRDKLVLPQEHRDLIDILSTDLSVLAEDVVDGKTGGTKILCQGAPGLGKTLTAEIYAEVIQRPLYSIHSGQLGTEPSTVQKSLETILKRGQRWNAVMLIDEADLYIRQRGDDLNHNAIVAEFLRTLEYHEGLLFLTTNRGGDVDDAIASRCVATITYRTPTKTDATAIWRIQAQQFGVTTQLTDTLVNQLTDTFATASGRDIRNLLKLATKFARHKQVPLSLELFRQCAQFRGL